MFDLGGETNEVESLNEAKYAFEEHKEFSNKELLSLEKEMLGFYLSGHPLEKMRIQIENETNINSIALRELGESFLENEEMEQRISPKYTDGQNVKYAGIITRVKKKYTKNNKIMAFVTIEDLYGQAEIICFENTYLKAGSSLVEENIVLVDRKIKH